MSWKDELSKQKLNSAFRSLISSLSFARLARSVFVVRVRVHSEFSISFHGTSMDYSGLLSSLQRVFSTRKGYHANLQIDTSQSRARIGTNILFGTRRDEYYRSPLRTRNRRPRLVGSGVWLLGSVQVFSVYRRGFKSTNHLHFDIPPSRMSSSSSVSSISCAALIGRSIFCAARAKSTSNWYPLTRFLPSGLSKSKSCL